MNFLSRHMGSVNLVAGFLLGCWIGYKILPVLIEPTLPTVEETADFRNARETLQRDLALTLLQSRNIVAASVHITAGRRLGGVPLRVKGGTAAVTLTFDDTGIRPGQLDTIADQVTGGVDGLDAGAVSIFDAQGAQLNLRAVQVHERNQFWKGIALNVAKVLGILAALITLRFIIRAVGRGGKC